MHRGRLCNWFNIEEHGELSPSTKKRGERGGDNMRSAGGGSPVLQKQGKGCDSQNGFQLKTWTNKAEVHIKTQEESKSGNLILGCQGKRRKTSSPASAGDGKQSIPQGEEELTGSPCCPRGAAQNTHRIHRKLKGESQIPNEP